MTHTLQVYLNTTCLMNAVAVSLDLFYQLSLVLFPFTYIILKIIFHYSKFRKNILYSYSSITSFKYIKRKQLKSLTVANLHQKNYTHTLTSITLSNLFQVMAGTKILAQYFKNNCHLYELNRTNPLGMKVSFQYLQQWGYTISDRVFMFFICLLLLILILY